MKTSVPKPLMRLAAAHTSASNRPQGPSQNRANLSLLSSRSSSSSSSSSSSPIMAESYTTTTSSTTFPTPRPNNLAFLQRNLTTRAYPPPYKFPGKLGALALIGGVMLFMGTASTAHSFFPFAKTSSPASRMKERLDKHGFIERVVVPDGNCQMRAISDQLHGDENRHKDVRSSIIKWLDTNEKFSVDDSGSTTLGDFIDREQFPKWATYTSYMARNGAWGDHITLLAAAEVYGVNIAIISNVEDNGTGQYITSINPRSRKPTKTINLSHWHEMHYNSLYPSKPVDRNE